MKKKPKSVTEFKKLYKSNQIKPKATPVAARKFQELEMKIDRVLLKLEAIENKLSDLVVTVSDPEVPPFDPGVVPLPAQETEKDNNVENP